MLRPALFAAALLVQSAAALAGSSTHLNIIGRPTTTPRFGTHAAYPTDLFAQPQFSDNSDGVTLSGRGGATLKIYAFWNVLNQAPRSYAAFFQRSDPPRHAQLTYPLVQPQFLILSGNGARLAARRNN
jgi:hypothetical protein